MTDTRTLPDELLQLERSAWTAIQNGTLTVGLAEAVHAGIAKHVGEDGDRLAAEMALKKLVRHPD